MVGVLAREASLAEGADQVDFYAEIARIWEDKIGEPAVANEAWRKVLESDPENVEALEHLVELNEQANDWTGFVEVARGLVRHREGAERSALLRRIGLVHAERLRRDDEAIRYLDGASAGDHPDLEAARALEALRAARGEWEHVVEALRRQARALPEGDRVEPLLKAARIKLDTLHNRDDASTLYAEILDQDGDNVDALRFLSDYRFARGDLAGSVDLYERLEGDVDGWDLDDFDVQIEASQYYYHFAQALLSVERPDDAELRLGKALKLNPTHLPSLKAVGPLYVADRKWKDAEKVYRQLLQLIGGTGDLDEMATIYTRLGEVERALGKMDKAQKRFNKALEIRPNDIAALRGIGSCLFAAGQWNNLLNIYNNIIYHARAPEDVIDAYLTKGHVLDARMGLPEKAAQHYQKILSFDPDQPAALLRLGELALRRQDWIDAATLAGRGLGGHGLTPEDEGLLRLVRAIALVSVGDQDAAGEEYDKAREGDVALAEALGDATVEDPDKLHEALRTRLLSAQP